MAHQDDEETGEPGKRASGGARATAAKYARMAAKRGEGYEQDWDAAIDELGPMPLDATKAISWTAAALGFALQSALKDKGLPPESRREQVARIAPQLLKALEPAKLAVKLEEYERALEEMQPGVQVNRAATGGTGQAPPQH